MPSNSSLPPQLLNIELWPLLAHCDGSTRSALTSREMQCRAPDPFRLTWVLHARFSRLEDFGLCDARQGFEGEHPDRFRGMGRRHLSLLQARGPNAARRGADTGGHRLTLGGYMVSETRQP